MSIQLSLWPLYRRDYWTNIVCGSHVVSWEDKRQFVCRLCQRLQFVSLWKVLQLVAVVWMLLELLTDVLKTIGLVHYLLIAELATSIISVGSVVDEVISVPLLCNYMWWKNYRNSCKTISIKP
ncbi:hypothetical protein E2562_032298 [Oryza meyeriana var. granulata]|uniref:Uncharacterized protein n=1 Tax=Oryza meyeriana var. granulata TaxID=110450 RepID=A0A6G1ERT5_9ORYZ|nr:hypothetical protein E2562_032298 [Oryza meyeriana var. granulata]